MTQRPFDGGGMSPAEHIEAALEKLQHLGWTDGDWNIVLHVRDGRLRRAVPHPVSADDSRRRALGRNDLDMRESAA